MEEYNLATQTLNKTNWFNFFENEKLEKAAELYKTSGNRFLLQNEIDKSIDSYVKAAECYFKLEQTHEEVEMYKKAVSNCNDFNKLSNLYQKILSIYLSKLDIDNLAKTSLKFAKLYENNNNEDIDGIINVYENALNYYSKINNRQYEMKDIIEKLAIMYCNKGDYQKAIEYFANILDFDMKITYLYNKYIFNILLCSIAIDIDDAKIRLDKFINTHYTFTNSKECKCVEEIINCTNVENFSFICNNIGEVYLSEPWRVKLLLKIKNKFANDEEEEDLT